MLDIKKIDHIGIRVRNKNRAISFYDGLGFMLLNDSGFEQGHPVMMRHSSGIVLNLLGPSSEENDENILMDVDRKYAGYTHIASRVESIADAENFFTNKGLEITGRFSFKGMGAIFVRDPDRNVIEFDEYDGEDPDSRKTSKDDNNEFYSTHP